MAISSDPTFLSKSMEQPSIFQFEFTQSFYSWSSQMLQEHKFSLDLRGKWGRNENKEVFLL